MGVKDHRLAGVFQREPDLLAVRRRRYVGTERADLGYSSDDLVICHGDHNGLRGEGGADIPILAVRREDLHAWAVRDSDTRLLFIGVTVKDGDIILAADRDPDLFAIWRKERLVRRPPNVGDILHSIRCGIDERDRVRADRNNREDAMIWWEPNAMHKHLSTVEGTQIDRH